MVDAIDQSWDTAPPEHAKAAGVQVVSGYLSHTPSKNWTRAKIDAYHAAGIGVILNWESAAGRPLLGAAAGKADATDAVAQARALGAPAGTCIYFSCDRDVTASQFGVIDGYYKATRKIVHKAGYKNGAYGEASLVTHLSGAGITDAEWQTYAWSGGELSPAADFYQYQNGQKLGGAAVDYNRIIHRNELGAWWPGEETDMPLSDDDIERIWAYRDTSHEKWQMGTYVGASWTHTAQVGHRAASADNRAGAVLKLVQDLPGRVADTEAKLATVIEQQGQILDALKALSGAQPHVTGEFTITGSGKLEDAK